MTKRSAQTSGEATAEVASYTTRPLDASTWDAFAELVERNNGVYGGCWCIAHHSEYQRGVSDPRTLKEELVRAGRAHAAIVFDEHDLAQGWCQYGSREELELSALTQIATAGGGLVEAISEVTAGREAQSRFLFSATVELFEQRGFTRGRQVGKHAWIVSRNIDPA